jgi:selenocysteine-specific elongation factor
VRVAQWVPTTEIDVAVRVLPSAEVGRRGAWHLHAGSGEWLVTVRPLSESTIRDEGFARLKLRDPACLVAGDRFVLREAGRRATVGGGVVLDTVPPPLVGAGGRTDRLTQLADRHRHLQGRDRPALLVQHVRERGAADLADAAAAVGMTASGAQQAARGAKLLSLGGAVAHPEAAGRWTAAVRSALADHHATHPVDRAAPRDVALRAAAAAGCPAHLSAALLDVLLRVGRVVAEGTGVRHPEHAVRLDPAQQRARDHLLATLNSSPYSPASLVDAARDSGADSALLRELEAAGEIVRLAPDIAMTADALAGAVARLRTAFAAEGPLTAARAKEILQTSRKYALPLLEELDRRGYTRREGDFRAVL